MSVVRINGAVATVRGKDERTGRPLSCVDLKAGFPQEPFLTGLGTSAP